MQTENKLLRIDSPVTEGCRSEAGYRAGMIDVLLGIDCLERLRMNRVTVASGLVLALIVAGCGKQGAQLGEGGSVVTGSAGPAGAQSAARELMKCDAPVATLALVENPNGYTMVSGYNLP